MSGLDLNAALVQAQRALKKMTRPKWHDRFAVNVPEGTSGSWRVEKFKVDAMGSMRSLSDPYPVPVGTYTRLMCTTPFPKPTRGTSVVWMSDTPAEVFQHFRFWKRAHGHVLVVGLGLGMITAALLKKSEVLSVTVIEKDSDVVDLVVPSAGWAADVEIGDAHVVMRSMRGPSKGKYDCCWLDIWPNISADNLPEVLDLERVARQRVVCEGGLVMSWEREMVELLAAHDVHKESRLPDDHPAVIALRHYWSESEAIVAELEAGTL